MKKSIMAALLLVCGIMFASGKDENIVQGIIALVMLLSAAMIFAADSVTSEKSEQTIKAHKRGSASKAA